METVCHSMEHLTHVALTHQSELQHGVAWRPQCIRLLCTEAKDYWCLTCFLPITHIHHGLKKSVPRLRQELGVLQLWVLSLSAD